MGLGSDQEASPSAGKNTRVVLVSCLHMEVHPNSYFWWCGYFWGLFVSFVTTDKFSVRVTKITSRIGVSWIHSLPFYFFPQFKLIGVWPYYQKHVKHVFSGCTVLLDSKETELRSSDQEASPSAVKNIGVVLVSCNVLVSCSVMF